MASATSAVGLSNPTSTQKPLMTQVIDAALLRMQGQILDIKTREIQDAQGQPDRDHNHHMTIVISHGEHEPASIFALKLNGEPKPFETVVQELVLKIYHHLAMRQNPDLIQLPSGAFITPQTDVSISVQNGYFSIDGKIVVMPADNQYIPIPAIMVNTYTSLIARQENDLVILNDEHETVRDDGKEGMIVNIHRPITLKRDQLKIHPKDANSASLKAEDTYLILYRTRKAAL